MSWKFLLEVLAVPVNGQEAGLALLRREADGVWQLEVPWNKHVEGGTQAKSSRFRPFFIFFHSVSALSELFLDRFRARFLAFKRFSSFLELISLQSLTFQAGATWHESRVQSSCTPRSPCWPWASR